MTMNYYGLSCVSVTAKPQTGEVTIVMDPYDNATGLRFPRTLNADLVFSSQEGDEHGNIGGVQGTPFQVTMPGEYEVKGLMIDARRAPTKDNPRHMIARVIADDISIGFLGGLDRELKKEELELVEGVDILVLPVGGEKVMKPSMAADVVLTVEPRVVVPVHYAEKGIKAKLADLKEFKKAVGPMPEEDVNKLKLSRKKLPQEERLLAVISRG